MAINYEELGQRLAISVRESPGFGIDDPIIRDTYRRQNAQRIWEIHSQCLLFDERDRVLMFATYSGLPTGVVNRYMEVCRKYQEDRVLERIKTSKAKAAASKKSKSKSLGD